MKKKIFLILVLLFWSIQNRANNRSASYFSIKTIVTDEFCCKPNQNFRDNKLLSYLYWNSFSLGFNNKIASKVFRNNRSMDAVNAPTGKGNQLFVGIKTLADLEVSGENLKWYDSSNVFLPNTTQLTDEATYSVTQTIGDDESSKLYVTVKKISEAQQKFCVGSTVANLVSTPSSNAEVSWFSAESDGNALSSREVLTTSDYYAEQAIDQPAVLFGGGLENVTALAINSAGEIFIADSGSSIKKMDSNGTIIATLGSGFSYVEEIAFDSLGNIYVADFNNNAIKKMDATGSTITTIATTDYPRSIAVDSSGFVYFTGGSNYDFIYKMDSNGENLQQIGNGFYFPQGLAIDALDNIYVADTFNQALKKMDTNGNNITTIGDENSFSNVSFTYPRKMHIDASGDIYIYANYFYKIDVATNTIKYINTNFTSNLTDFVGDALGNMYFTYDTSTLVKKPISKISNRVAVSVKVTIPPVANNLQIFVPGNTLSDLVVTGSDIKWYDVENVLLANSTELVDNTTYSLTQTVDGEESCKLDVLVKKISEAEQNFCSTAKVSDLVSTPSTDTGVSWFLSANGGTKLNKSDVLTANTYHVQQESYETSINIGAGFLNPPALTTDVFGNVYVLSYNGIKKMDSNGNLLATFSTYNQVFSGSIAVDPSGNIYVADTNENRILKMDADGNNLQTIGYGFSDPQSIALDDFGNVFVLQSNSIIKMDTQGNNIQTIRYDLSYPQGIAVDKSGTIYVVEYGSSLIKKMDSNGNILEFIDSGIYFMNGIEIDAANDIYFLSYVDGLRKMDANGDNIRLIATGSTNLTDFAIDNSGNIFVTNENNISKTVAKNSNRVPIIVNISSPTIIPTFIQIEPVFEGAELSYLPTISTNGIEGTWSPELNNTQTTTYTFTPTDTCAASNAFMTIEIIPSTPTFEPIDAICSGETLNALPTISTNGVEGTWSPQVNSMETTTYTFSPNNEGISSVTMTIIVNPSTANTTTISACDSYTWDNNGMIYSESGTYRGTTTNCVTEVLELTINNSSRNLNSITACETFTWAAPIGNGLTYTSSQTAINVTTNEMGCPNIEILDITINPKPDAPENLTCYQTAEFDNETCQWNIVGEQPVQPTELACYQTVGDFNTASCQWNIVGEQPEQPTELACYQTVGEFNTTTCQWTIVGEQPVQPLQANCWDNFVFDTENCSWSNIGTQPQAPTANPNQTFGPGATVASLIASGSDLKWYNQATSGGILLPNTILTSGTYYVSQTVNGCESQRVSVDVILTAVFCSGATVSNLVVPGGINVSWFSSLTSTTALSSTNILSTRLYYFTQTIGGIQTAKIPVSVVIDLASNASSITGASGTICYNSGKTLSLSLATLRGNVQWQSSASATGPFTPILGATATTFDTGNLTSTTFYNAVVTNGVCPSRVSATATVSVIPQSVAGTISGNSASICPGSNSTLLTSNGRVGSIQWHSSTDNINFVSLSPNGVFTTFTASNLTATTFYRAVVTNGIGCTPAISASFAVNVKPVVNSGIITGPLSVTTNNTATMVLTGYTSGATLTWRQSSTLSGTYIFGTQPILVQGSYTTAKLSKDAFYRVVVTKDGCSSTSPTFFIDVVPAKINAPEDTFKVIAYPNPFSNTVKLDVSSSSKTPVEVKVFDLLGRLIETRSVKSFEMSNQEIGNRYASGVYNLIIKQGANIKTLRVIKQ